jgi:hypothetical protein
LSFIHLIFFYVFLDFVGENPNNYLIKLSYFIKKYNQLISPGNIASVSLTRTVIDNRDLEWSAIAPAKCITPGTRDPRWVDADLLYGVDPNYGYSKDACNAITKREMLARELVSCTFSPLPADT